MQPQFRAGRYTAQVKSQAFGKSSAGNHQFILQVEPLYILDGEQWRAVAVQGVRTIWLTITDKTVERIVGQLKAIGWNGERWADLDPDSGTVSFVDSEIELICRHEPDHKNPSELRERWELAGGGQSELENDPSAAKTLDVMFKRQSKPAAKPAAKLPPKPAAKPQPAAAVVEDSAEDSTDIPF